MAGMKKKRKIIIVKTIMACMILLLCTVGAGFADPDTGFAASGDPLLLIDSYPQSGAINVSRSPVFTLTFSKNISDESVKMNNKAAITAQNEDGELVDAQVSFPIDSTGNFADRQKLQVELKNLEYETSYKILIDSLFKAKNGMTLEGGTTIRFTTEKKPEEQESGDEHVDTDAPGGKYEDTQGEGHKYNDTEEVDDGSETTDVVINDGGDEEELYKGGEGDCDEAGNGAGESTKKNGSGENRQITQEESRKSGVLVAASGKASDSGEGIAQAPDESKSEEDNDQNDDNNDNINWNKELTTASQQLPKFDPSKDKEVSYIALAFEAGLVASAAAAAWVIRKKKS